MNFLSLAISEALKASFDIDLAAEQISLEQTKKEFTGHATLVVFPFVRQTKKSPEQTAEQLGAYLKDNYPEIADYNVISNFRIIVFKIGSQLLCRLLGRFFKDN